MERLERDKNAAVECYGLAIASTEQNVIELDQEQASLFRAELQALVKQLGEGTTPEQLRKIQDRFHEDLREYRHHAHEQIRQLRNEISAGLSALEGLAVRGTAYAAGHANE